MPMQPSPSADTNSPDLPSSRVSIVSSTVYAFTITKRLRQACHGGGHLADGIAAKGCRWQDRRRFQNREGHYRAQAGSGAAKAAREGKKHRIKNSLATVQAIATP